MLILAALVLGALHSRVEGQFLVPDEPNVLTPPYFNIATGKEIEATATCGEFDPQVFCKLTGGPNEYGYSANLYQGQYCDICNTADPVKSHPIKYAIDGTEKWWQSPPLSQGTEYNKINVTIHLGQVFHVAYAIIKFANSPRAGTWVLERSSDHGRTFQPWQYFANSDSDCHNLFGIDAFEGITQDNSVICTSEYSDVVPLERGEVIVSIINDRPGASNFSYSPVLQEWSKATDVRLRLLRTKTLLGHLMAVQRQDPTVTRRYFYSIKDISIGGRCVCNGHADTCVPDPFNKYKLKCECRHNTCGDSCGYCCPGFVQKAWRAAVPETTNECEACNCHGHSTECVYDEQVAIQRRSLDLYDMHEGGGVCQNCAHNTAGINCEICVDGYYRPVNVDPRDPNGCRPCDCDSAFTVGNCEPLTGRCYCKPKYAGDRCDRCAPGYHRFPDCEPCPCYFNATRNGICLPVNGVCPCKYNFAGKYCGECAYGFYNFPECASCACTGQGAVSDICDPRSGQCDCEEGFGGLICNECAPGYYKYPVCHSCSCYAEFTTDQVCDPETGRCLCEKLVTGKSCDRCKPGYYDFPNCIECECDFRGTANALCDAVSGKCQCKPNYQGPICDECAPDYFGYPNCVPCNCDIRGSSRNTCDPTTGDCTCFSHIVGQRCDRCASEYFNFPRCEDCKCNQLGIESAVPGVCLAFTTGHCDCKENVVGKYCDMCAPQHYNLALDCVDCDCFLQGTLDGVAACDSEEGDCWCKPYTCSQRCSRCEDGFFDLQERNYFGCSGCQCDSGGAVSQECETIDGQCQCKDGIEGRQCDTVSEGYYFPTLLQYKFEVEDGKTSENEILRFGFSEDQFPSFSGKGYGEFSVVQHKITVPINVATYGLYKFLFYYVYPNGTTTAKVTLSPVTSDGSEQDFDIQFEPSPTPALFVSKQVFVLNNGEWSVVIKGDPGLLIDYVVLLPSEYYEPSKLQASITVPCKPVMTPTGNKCLMYDHPLLDGMPVAVATDFADREQHDAPTTAHPMMVMLDGNSLNDDHKTVNVVLESVKSPGEYVLVLEYASTEDRMQTVKAIVTDGAGRRYDGAIFHIYSCGYSFMCRQVALTARSDVMVFDASMASIEAGLSVRPGDVVFVKAVHAVPYEQWTLGYVEPKRRCISMEGPEFEECIVGAYPTPATSKVIDAVASNNIDDVPTATDDLTNAKFIGNGNNTFTINMDLEPGRYVFLLHYFNPNHTSFESDVIVAGGPIHEGAADIEFCPSGDGCRAVVTTDDDDIVLDITSPSQTITITAPEDKSFWLDYVLAVPENAYDDSLLDLEPIDSSRMFFDECYGVGSEGLVESAREPTEFCKDAVFSLSMHFNDGALPCDCSGSGTVGGAGADCEDFGGQCPCRPNVIGRQCDRCKTGFYDFPDCKPCDCNGSLCDEINGNCICPPNTVEPGCDRCQPFTHSFHPLAGCVACDCHQDGVEIADDLGCGPENGQCRCKENVQGIRCDTCEQGLFGFPNCRPCVCDRRGRVSEGCDAASGQCLCKENVEGQQCDRCKRGTFFLDESNPLGCTACFCFGATVDCVQTRYPTSEIVDMTDWRLLNMKIEKPEVVANGDTVSVDIDKNGGPVDPTRANLFWAAPKAYLNDKIGSYGGDLRFVIDSERNEFVGGRGDSTVGEAPPAPLTTPGPTVILEGQGMVIGWTNRGGRLEYPTEVDLKLAESNFVHQATSVPVKRPEMMLVLQQLSSLKIRASEYPDATYVSLSGVNMTTTDYDAQRGSGESLPTVEECICPNGYTGRSCEMCDVGHYRDSRGPYLGFCSECDCFGHCDFCDDIGNIQGEKQCKHNTTGDRCEKCENGYIGDATSGDSDACQPCPCLYPREDGNFAERCEYDFGGNVICYCEYGYTGAACEQCTLGFFGNPLVIGGTCKKCNCHGNLDNNLLMEICEPLTGECSDCLYNTGGKYCERCADGYFGDAVIAKNCSRCPCDECGTLQCDHELGFCECKGHVIGTSCERCEPGHWNFDACNGCETCGCGVGSIEEECDASSGQCRCAPNVVGMKCDRCAPGHWDYSFMGCKPCDCRNDGDCNPANGECMCPPGIEGAQCDQCKLDRHVLSPGGLECQSCDPCTDDLLDVIEPMTRQVRNVTDQLSQVSIGVAAAQRLEHLKAQANNASDDVEKLRQEIEDVEAGFDEPMNPETHSLDTRIAENEQNVSFTCNKSHVLLENVETTKKRTVSLDANSTKIVAESGHFNNDTKDLLEKLNAETLEESEEYLRKLTNAQMLIQKMKDREFSLLQVIADTELSSAEELYNLVKNDFILSADDLDNKVDVVRQNLTEKLAKMKELRKRLNDATDVVTKADAQNAANSKALLAARNVVNDIKVEWEIIDNIIEEARNVLNGGDTSGDAGVILHTEELKREIEKLQQEYDAYVAALQGVEELVDQAMEKALTLRSNVNELERLVAETKNDSRLSRAVEAANRFQTIVNTMADARAAADAAERSATEAKDDVTRRKMKKAAKVAFSDSKELLKDVQRIQEENLTRLWKDFNDSKSSKDDLEKVVGGLNRKLEEINSGIANLNPGETDAVLDETIARTEEANGLTAMVIERANDLMMNINDAPDPNFPLNEEFKDLQDLMINLENDIEDVVGTIETTKKQADRIKKLPGQLQLDDKMNEIRKKIELSRSRADSVTVSMAFKRKQLKDGVYPEYAQVHIPRQSFDLSDSVEIDVLVNVSKSGDNSLLFLGDTSSDSGDYVALETIGGLVHYYYKVDSGVGELQSRVPINDNIWHRVIIQRDGEDTTLKVYYPDPQPSRGDSLIPELELVDMVKGKIEGGKLKASLPMESTPLVIGGMPLKPRPGRLRNDQMTGCLKDLKVNSERVGMWNFVSYNGPKPGLTCRSIPSSVAAETGWWRFRGVDSYVMVSQEQLNLLGAAVPGTVVGFVGFKMTTQQHDGLVFLAGEDTNQFYALEVRDGNLVVSYNFGWEQTRIAKSELTGAVKSPNVSAVEQPFNIKFAVIDQTAAVLVILFLNNQPVINVRFTDGKPDVQGDVWFGGIHRNDLKSEFRQHVTTVESNYRGCISHLKFHIRMATYNLYEADERLGVTPGCQRSAVPVIDPMDDDYISVGADYPNIAIIDSLEAEEDDEKEDENDENNDDDDAKEEEEKDEEEPPTKALFEVESVPPPEDYDPDYTLVPEEEEELQLIFVDTPNLKIVDDSNTKKDAAAVKVFFGDSGKTVEEPGMAEDHVPVISRKKKVGVSPVENPESALEEKEKIKIVNIEEADEGVVRPEVTDIDLKNVKENVAVGVDDERVVVKKNHKGNKKLDVIELIDPPAATAISSPEEEINDEILKVPEIDIEEQAQVAQKNGGGVAEQGDSSAASVLPAILIIMGVIVGVVLLAAVVSAVLKGSLFAGGAGGSSPPNMPIVPAERAPLNSVQAQRVAQIDW